MRKSSWIIPVLFLIAALGAPTVHADDVVQVDVSNLIFSGNNVCGPLGTSQCIETLNGSFLWDNTTAAPVAGSFQTTLTGPVAFTFGDPSLAQSPVQQSVFVVQFSGESTLQDFLFVNIVIQGPVLNPGDYPANPIDELLPGTTNAGMECQETHAGDICFPDFGMSFFPAQGSTIVAPAPEPASLPLASIGILGLGLILKKTTR
jgi:hypothetical protein